MDLDQLHTFLEIVRLKSFSKAAQTCYRTQPAISAQVRQLELELNATLFERYGTRISLTVAGRIFAEHAEQILALRKQAQDAINELERVPRGELVIHSDEIKLLIPANHRLASASRVLPSDMVGEQILLPKTGATRARLNTWLESVHDELTVSMELDSTEMIKRFVMANLGISFIAHSHCQEEEAAGKVTCIPLGPESMIRRVGLIYRKDKSLSKAALGFIEVTRDHAGNEIGVVPIQRMRA